MIIRDIPDIGWCRIIRARFQTASGVVEREIEDHGDAVAVLPYDPQRKKLMLIRLMRAPVVWASGPGDLIECPAGMIDKGEDAEATARREVLEEAGLRLHSLDHVGRVWTSPGISSERMSLFLAPYASSDRVDAGGGLAEEHENIAVFEIDISQAWQWMQAEITDLKTRYLLLALKERRPDLFGA